MSDGFPVAEFRRSFSLLRSESWVVTGAVLGYLCYGVWVLATGLAIGSVTPGLATSRVATVGGVSVTGLSALAIVLWLVVPGIVVASLAGRRFLNEHGNLANRYRLDHPSLLLVPPGVGMLGCLVATVSAGRSTAVTAIALVASVHLLVRTIAYGYRVYTLSVPRLFALFLAVAGAALAGGWLVHVTVVAGVSGTVDGLVARAGVISVAETGLELAAVTPGVALAALVSIPALLSAGYLVVQFAAGTVVRMRAPLATPTRRPGQRFPTMPPTNHADAAVAGDGATGTEPGDEASATDDEATADGETDAGDDTVSEDDHSHTRVFTPDQSVSEDGEAATDVATVDGVAPEAGDDGNDGWEDDTAVFTLDREESAGPETCDACGREIADETTVTFCPDCGERLP